MPIQTVLNTINFAYCRKSFIKYHHKKRDKVQEYVEAVTSSTMTIDAVPEEYKTEVHAIIDGQGKDLTSEEILTELESEVGIND